MTQKLLYIRTNNKRAKKAKLSINKINRMLEYIDDYVQKERYNAYKRYRKHYGEPKVGLRRAVFVDGTTVLKIPLNSDGEKHNLKEAYWNNKEIPLAPCWLKKDEYGFTILVMEKVTPIWSLLESNPTKNLPKWCEFVDNFQVGYRSSGELVAYDL